MNKYSQKLVDFIINNSAVKRHYSYNQPLNTVYDILNDIQVVVPQPTVIQLDPINTGKYPLIYQNYINQFPNFQDFYIWYMANHHLKIKNIQIDDSPYFAPLVQLLYQNPFVSLDIDMVVESKPLLFEQYNQDDINFTVYSDGPKPNMERLFTISQVMRKYSSNPIPINVTILATNKRKQILNTDFLGPINVNSGSSITGKIINLWRLEEIEKVLFHELIHYLGMDQQRSNFDSVIKLANKHYPVKGKINPNEAFTETMAVFFHTTYLSHLLKKDFNQLYNMELNHSLHQASKIKNFFNKRNKQTSSIVSYYLLKTALLYDLNSFMKHGNMINIIENVINDNNYKKGLEYYNKLDTEGYIKYNLRMTCLQIK